MVSKKKKKSRTFKKSKRGSKKKISRAVEKPKKEGKGIEKEKPEIVDLKTEKVDSKGVLDKSEIILDGAKAEIFINKTSSGVVYEVRVPDVGVATNLFLDDIRSDLVMVTTVNTKEITDPHEFSGVKKQFMAQAEKLLKERMPNLSEENKKLLVGKLMQDMLGLGKIEFLINDPNLEEVVIPSSKEPIRVYHKKFGWIVTNLRVPTEEEIGNYANIIARRVGRQITVLKPLLDAHLVTGDRANAILYPISTKGSTITIRKFSRDPYTIIDFISNKTCDMDTAALLWLAIEFEMNVLISGGTASGKTSLLNSCMPFIPPNNRIISVEDTRELMLPEFLYWTPLVTRLPNPEGKGEVSMLDLLVNSLRMRPDRIVLGEMRRREEAMVLFEAMHTGHSVYATLHADSSAETISRLVNPPLSVPANLLRSVNLNVVMFRDRKRGIRRISQLSEFEVGDDRASANILYRWIPEKDEIVKHNMSTTFFENLSRHTGMSDKQIKEELEFKKSVFSWMIKNKIRKLEELGKVMNYYYVDREELKRIMKNNEVNKITK